MSMAMTTQLGSQLGNLLQLVQNLDEQIKVCGVCRSVVDRADRRVNLVDSTPRKS
jgi:hypothetical protein